MALRKRTKQLIEHLKLYLCSFKTNYISACSYFPFKVNFILLNSKSFSYEQYIIIKRCALLTIWEIKRHRVRKRSEIKNTIFYYIKKKFLMSKVCWCFFIIFFLEFKKKNENDSLHFMQCAHFRKSFENNNGANF